LVFAGIGAAAGVVGGALWYSAKTDADQAATDCGGRKQCPSDVAARGNEAVDRQIRWTIVGAAGGALAVGGLIWYFVQSPEDADNAHWSPQVTTGFAGLDYRGSF
jgi:hypothetical protein